MFQVGVSTFVRLSLAMLVGGLLGWERERKHRPAGFRTYMLVCMGAALTVMLSQYVAVMMQTVWADEVVLAGGPVVDLSRLAAQVINGIGFLGAGSILVTPRHEVQGLNTAAGLWSTACLGIAIGAGFYTGVIVAFVLMSAFIVAVSLWHETGWLTLQNVELYVEFERMSDLGGIIAHLKNMRIEIYDVEVNTGAEQKLQGPNVVFTVHYPKSVSHERVLASVAELPGVRVVEEI